MAGVTALYCRRSKAGKEGVADTVESQEAELRAYAAAHGWNQLQVYREKGASAGPAQDKRRKVFYGELVPAIERGEVSRVLSVEVDRLSRYMLAFWTFVEETCRPRGVEVFLSRSGTRINGETSVLELAIRSGLASEESRIRSDRSKSHRERMRQAGRKRSGGWRKYGYEADNTTIRASEAAVIRESASMILAGQTLRAATLAWWAAGIRTSKGRLVNASTVRMSLLKTDLIDPETSLRVRAVLTDPSRGSSGYQRRTFLLTGLAVCSVCGSRLEAQTAGRRKVYLCRKTSAGGGTEGCGGVRVDAGETERAVLDILLAGLAQQTFAERHGSTPGLDLSLVAAERSTILAKLDACADAFADGTFSKDQSKRMNDRLNARLAELDDLLHSEATPQKTDLLSRWQEFDRSKIGEDRDVFEFYRACLEAAVERVECQNDLPPVVHVGADVSLAPA